MLTFKALSFQSLTTGLMLKLIVLTEVTVAEGALENPAPVFPHSSLALHAHGIRQRTGAGMCRQALATVTHPPFTEVTDCTLSLKQHNYITGRQQI